jgi:gamma-glutamylcyclotransferase (GGCT)/AIG2-like uncharacterized protein YtfP
MSVSLFSYGTLEIPLVIEAVTGKSFPSTAAVLPDFARFLLQGEMYPGIFRDGGSEVTGVLYEQVDRDSLALLDLFEGDFFRREEVQVATPSEPQVDAYTYVVPPERRLLFSDQPWDREAFISRNLADFLPYCREFHRNHTRRLGIRSGPG